MPSSAGAAALGVLPFAGISTSMCGRLGVRQENLLSSTPHDPRSTIHDPRSTIHDPRSTIHDPRSTIHDPRSTIHDPRSTIHVTEAANAPCQASEMFAWAVTRVGVAMSLVDRDRLDEWIGIREAVNLTVSPLSRRNQSFLVDRCRAEQGTRSLLRRRSFRHRERT